ncbi:MAG: aminopeptidase [Chloroflexi bacterium]|nr:aminopeptidase [Chloroflexota bacterium]
MPDPRVQKLAKVLVHYSIELKPGQKMILRTTPLADELTLAVYEEAIKAGAHVLIFNEVPGAQEIFYKFGNDEQLQHVSDAFKLALETYDAMVTLWADVNTRHLSGVNPERIAMTRKASQPLGKVFFERAAKGELRWTLTQYPTHARAQDADMSLRDYTEFVYGAGMLNEADPVAYWQAEGQSQRRLISWLAGKDRVALKGEDVDLTLSIKDRIFMDSDGKYNFPDGEIFTGPVEDSANGWVRFGYPAIHDGQEATNIELWFENGRIVREKADKGQEMLTAILNTDQGSRYLGEWGIGTNYGIQRFTKNMLFDEKMGGTIHLAMGASYPETGGKNESGLHWDMLCNMAHSEITVDGELFYKDGKAVV